MLSIIRKLLNFFLISHLDISVNWSPNWYRFTVRHWHFSTNLGGDLHTICYFLVFTFVFRDLVTFLLIHMFTDFLGNFLAVFLCRSTIAYFVWLLTNLCVHRFANLLLFIFANLIVNSFAFFLDIIFAFNVLTFSTLSLNLVLTNTLYIINTSFNLKEDIIFYERKKERKKNILPCKSCIHNHTVNPQLVQHNSNDKY